MFTHVSLNAKDAWRAPTNTHTYTHTHRHTHTCARKHKTTHITPHAARKAVQGKQRHIHTDANVIE